MDGVRFDAWTRRRFHRAVAGGTLALLGLGSFNVTLAKKKKKKKKKKIRCQALPSVFCNDKKPCCEGQGFLCLPRAEDPAGPARCCQTGLAACQVDDDCCSSSCMNNVCSCKSNGQPCGGIGSLCCSLQCGGNPELTTCQPA